MSEKEFELTEHAAIMITEREIQLEWVERVFQNPEKIEPDKIDRTLLHSLGRIRENENRVLRVIHNYANEPPLIVTAFFDRKMKDRL